MSQLVTATSILDRVRFAGDSQGSTLRLTDADLTVLLYDSWARYAAHASGNGWPYWLKHATGTLEVGRAVDDSASGYAVSPATDYPFGLVTVDFGSNYTEGITRFEIRLSTGEWVDLEPTEFQHVNAGQLCHGTGNGQPEAFWAHAGSFDSDEIYPGNHAQYVGFYPPADQEYTFRAWYVGTARAGGSDLEVGVIGGEWWIVWDMVETIAIRDHYPDLAQLAAMKRQQCWTELVARVAGRNKGKSFRVQDTKGQRRLRGARGWRY